MRMWMQLVVGADESGGNECGAPGSDSAGPQKPIRPIPFQSKTLNTPLSTIEKFSIMDLFEDSIVPR